MTLAEKITDEDLIVHEGLEGLREAPSPVPEKSVQVKDLDGKDIQWVYVYHRDGSERVIRRSNAQAVLSSKLQDGTRVFSNRPWPGVRAFKGSVMCNLHPEHPNRQMDAYRSFPLCMSKNLASEYERDRHMEKRHNNEWKALNASKVDEDREMNRLTQEATVKMAEAIANGTGTVAGPAAEEAHPRSFPTKKCDECGAFFFQQRQVDKHVAEVHASEPESPQ